MALLQYYVGNQKNDYALTQPETTLGRSKEAVLVLAHDVEISRVHCRIAKAADNHYDLLDNESRNGTFINGARLGPEPVALVDGDKIRIGKTQLLFVDPAVGRTTALFLEVAGEIEGGKGFATILKEIVDKK